MRTGSHDDHRLNNAGKEELGRYRRYLGRTTFQNTTRMSLREITVSPKGSARKRSLEVASRMPPRLCDRWPLTVVDMENMFRCHRRVAAGCCAMRSRVQSALESALKSESLRLIFGYTNEFWARCGPPFRSWPLQPLCRPDPAHSQPKHDSAHLNVVENKLKSFCMRSVFAIRRMGSSYYGYDLSHPLFAPSLVRSIPQRGFRTPNLFKEKHIQLRGSGSEPPSPLSLSSSIEVYLTLAQSNCSKTGLADGDP